MTSALIDANVFFYAAGREHRLREPSRQVLSLAADATQLFTDAEVLQELLHRYIALRMWPDIRASVISYFRLMAGRIEPMYAEDVSAATDLVVRYPRLSARDLVHVAIAQRVGASHIITADRAFEGVEGLARLEPADVGDWRALFAG